MYVTESRDYPQSDTGVLGIYAYRIYAYRQWIPLNDKGAFIRQAIA
jgi:hypothetical protein